jgi:hypothetical protein
MLVLSGGQGWRVVLVLVATVRFGGPPMDLAAYACNPDALRCSGAYTAAEKIAVMYIGSVSCILAKLCNASITLVLLAVYCCLMIKLPSVCCVGGGCG